jgi:hypothetical protein
VKCLASSIRSEFEAWSPSSYSLALNRNQLRATSTAVSTAKGVAHTHQGRLAGLRSC